MTDLTKLSDEELQAIIDGGSPAPAPVPGASDATPFLPAVEQEQEEVDVTAMSDAELQAIVDGSGMQEYGQSFSNPDLSSVTKPAEEKPLYLYQTPDAPLPPPSYDIYEGIEDNWVEQQKVYQRYLDDPRAEKNIVGSLSIDGLRVPAPGATRASNIMTDEIYDGTMDLGVTALSLVDYFRAKTLEDGEELKTSWAEWLENNTTRMDLGDNIGRQLLGGAANIFGGVGALKAPVKVGEGILNVLVKSSDEVVEEVVKKTAKKKKKGDKEWPEPDKLKAEALSLQNITKSISNGFTSKKPLFKNWRSTSPDAIRKFAVFELGAVGGVGADTGTLFVGEDAMIDLFDGIERMESLDTDPNDPRYEQILNKKRNMLVEAVALAAPITAGIQSATWAAATLWKFGPAKLLTAGKITKREEATIERVLDKLAQGAGVESTPEFQQELVKLIKEGMEVEIKMDSDLLSDVEYTTTTMDAIRRALEEEDGDMAVSLVREAMKLQKGVILQDGATAAKAGQANQRFDDSTTEAISALGGEDQIDSAATILQDEGADVVRRAVDDQDINVQQAQLDAEQQIDEAVEAADLANTSAIDAEEALRVQVQAVDDALANDPMFGEALTALVNRTGVNVSGASRGNAEDIVMQIREGIDTLKRERQTDFYEPIAQAGGSLDVDSLVTQIRKIEPATLQAAFGAMPNSSLGRMGDIVDPMKNKRLVDPSDPANKATRPATDEEMAIDLTDALLEAGVTDYGTFYKNIRAELSSTADSMYRAFNQSGDPKVGASASVLRSFVNYIDDDLLAKTGDDTIAELVDRAKEFDVNVYYPIANDGVVRNVTQEGVQRGVNRPAPQSATLMDNSVQMVDTGLGVNRASEGAKLVEFLGGKYGRNPSVAADYIINKVFEPLANRLNSNGELTEEMFEEALQSLTQYGSVLDQFPEIASKVAKVRDDLRVAIAPRSTLEQGANASRKSADRAAKQAELTTRAANKNAEKVIREQAKIVSETKDRIYNDELREFFQGSLNERVGTGSKAFDKVFEDMATGSDLGRVSDITQRVYESGNPILVEGYRAAMVKTFRKRFLVGSVDSNGTRMVSAPKLLLDDVDELTKYIDTMRVVFKGDEGFVDGVEQLLKDAGAEITNRSSSATPLGSATAARQEQKNSLDRMVTAGVGVLSRLGAMLRGVGGAVINKLTPDDALILADKMLADPEYFIRVSDRFFNTRTPMDKDLNKALIQLVYRSGLLRGDEDPEAIMVAAMEVATQLEQNTNEIGKQIQYNAEQEGIGNLVPTDYYTDGLRDREENELNLK